MNKKLDFEIPYMPKSLPSKEIQVFLQITSITDDELYFCYVFKIVFYHSYSMYTSKTTPNSDREHSM